MKSRVSLLFIAVLICFSSIAQTKKVAFNNSPIVPGAEGTVRVKKDKNSNYQIEISIANLAEPKKLTPPKKTYMVWLESENGIKKIGRINSSSSLFSKVKKASIETSSPYKPAKIFVTAEDDENAEEPGTVIVLTTDTF